MLKYGHEPYYECSSRGDKRFSAFYARPKSLGGKSIEEAYQGMKIFPDGSTGLSWREAKGKTPINIKECKEQYHKWWWEWVHEQNLVPILLSQSGLSDMFGQPGHLCQAEVLWKIKKAYEKEESI
jgi:hypothetical protein